MAEGRKGAGRPKVARSVLDLIGNTAMIRLARLPRPGRAAVLAKLESQNPGGSVKDRIALAMVEDAERRGALKPGATLVEPTSGNTGIGLAMVAAVKGYRLILTMPDDMSIERQQQRGTFLDQAHSGMGMSVDAPLVSFGIPKPAFQIEVVLGKVQEVAPGT